MPASAQVKPSGSYNNVGFDYVSPITSGGVITFLTAAAGSAWGGLDCTNKRLGVGTATPSYVIHGLDASNSTSQVLAAFLQSSLALNESASLYVGRAASANLAAVFSFTPDPGTPANSYGSVGLVGTPKLVNFSGGRHILFDTLDTDVTTNSGSGNGAHILNGRLDCAAAGTVASFNRLATDGLILEFKQDGTKEGDIAVSGTTISYNAFCGSHWSQLADGSRPVIPRGTLVSSINELCQWAYIEERSKRTKGLKRRNVPPGTPNSTLEQNDRLAKFKVTDTSRDPAVYGVFSHWDEDGDAVIHSLGATVARVIGPTTAGDLLESGPVPGVARKQIDNGIRSTTLGKVTAGRPDARQDEEYLVSVVLYAG